ncbi:hypothetical protein KQ874_01765 [Mycoplasma sp. ES3157-GEN-MYC]|uniref:Uncharacterized protein n=1 Tax=Mycoplasma miroungigenitalium TaxID=754515 RepID=A0A6M4JBP1_9MOLU|nr:hypothetical protein [Mycoplasma miroungigenitalium]MBU4690415.1 hypothetical protein [Mycoplasma miroungigenitalium]MBU4691682.1 hypothetical protein [Mycoplasma miroungigenitalium]QJR43509.1 hypothetical protein HLA87_01760 [Mycoplasma miroungigenitalium]
MSKTEKVSMSHSFYEIVKSFEENQKLNLSDIVNVFSEETTKILSKIDPEVEVEYILNEENQTLTPVIKSMIVISDEEAQGYLNSSMTPGRESDVLLMHITYISLSDAKAIDKSLEEGDTVERVLDLERLSEAVKNTKYSNLLKTIHSSIKQGMSSLRKQKVFETFKDKIGERVRIQFNARNADGSWNVQITDEHDAPTTAYLPSNHISSRREIKAGQYAFATILSVEEEAKLSQVQVSMDSKENVEELLKRSIPEINEGIIEIVETVRQPGERTKVAFKASALAPADFDVFGSIIGPNGQRITAINQEIGEKIDVILYDEDPKKFIRNAMSPARIIDVVAKNGEDQNSTRNVYWVIVAKDGLTPAIGRRGINVSLASNLTKCNLDVISEKDALEQGIKFNYSNAVEIKSSPIRRNTRNNKKAFGFDVDLDKIKVSADSFDTDVLNFQEQEFADIDTSSFDLDFEELFKKHTTPEATNVEQPQTVDEIAQQLEEESKNQHQVRNDVEDYKKVKEALKDFKVDDDLSSYGLDEFDLDEFLDDDAWED